MAVKSATLFFYTDLQDKFEKFVENLKINLESLCQNHPFLIALIGDLNVKTKKWYCHDKSSYEGSVIENVTALYDLIIKEPSHISITSSFCSDPIFTSKSILITESGVHSSLHPNCNNQFL